MSSEPKSKRDEIPIPFFEKIISNETFVKVRPAFANGGCGKVYKINFLENQKKELFNFDISKQHAMKKFKRFDMKYFLREIGIQNSLNHPFVLNLSAWVGFYKSYNTEFIKFSPRIIMPFAERRDLEYCVMNDFKEWSQTEKYKLIYSICRSVWFLHKLKIFHRDIKPLNILIMNDKTPKIADFGFTKIKKTDDSNSLSFKVGAFLAPECYTLKSSYPADVFSLSLCLYEIFECSSIFTYFSKKVKNRYSKALTFYSDINNRPPFTEKTPQIWQEIISSMWCAEPLERESMDSIMKEIENKKYYLEGSDKKEIERFIEEVKREESERYFSKANDTLRYLKKEDIFNNINDHNFLQPFKHTTPVNIIIDQFYINSSKYIEQEYNNDTNISDNDNDHSQSIPETSKSASKKSKCNLKLIIAKYNQYILLFNKMIRSLFSLSLINDPNAQISIASYCIFELNDFMSAYSILENCEKIGSKDGQTLIQLMLLESKKSILARAMILEAQGKYQEAIDAYFECIENEIIDISAIGRLGRVLAVFGENEEVRKEGLEMLENAASYGDHFSAFHLGRFYYKKASDDNQDVNANIEKAIECFNMAENFADVDLMIYLCYSLINDKPKMNKYHNNVSDIYYEY